MSKANEASPATVGSEVERVVRRLRTWLEAGPGKDDTTFMSRSDAIAVLVAMHKMAEALEFVLEDDGLIPRATSATRKVCRKALSA